MYRDEFTANLALSQSRPMPLWAQPSRANRRSVELHRAAQRGRMALRLVAALLLLAAAACIVSVSVAPFVA